MGKNPINRILDFLIENDRDSWNMVEIRDNANVGYSTLKQILPKMLNSKLIKITKTVGKSNLYMINKNSEIVNKIYELHKKIIESEIENFIN